VVDVHSSDGRACLRSDLRGARGHLARRSGRPVRTRRSRRPQRAPL